MLTTAYEAWAHFPSGMRCCYSAIKLQLSIYDPRRVVGLVPLTSPNMQLVWLVTGSSLYQFPPCIHGLMPRGLSKVHPEASASNLSSASSREATV